MILSDSALQLALDSGDLAIVDELGITRPGTQVRSCKIDPEQIQPASIDLHLGDEFAFWRTEKEVINFAEAAETFPAMKQVKTRSIFAIQPHGFALATTAERVTIGARYKASIDGKSSLGRVGLLVHATAGFLDPGFDGQVTLELFNLSPHWMQVLPGQLICQLAVYEVAGIVSRPYGDAALGSKYSRQRGVTLSRWKGVR